MDYRLKKKFERLYGDSSPSDRELFDNPETRGRVPTLTRAFEAYQKTDRRRGKNNSLNLENEARAVASRELDDFLFGLEFMAGALDYHFKNSAPKF
ncbi:hypothetical protein AUJ84_03675 [Candidatus Pacearchaeota archaeon CG1_02_32_132]|nr:MAG: hypothetical protein AUJ84_03675 [Candidatus Pacearchaeota archaeon CG1_02_32_132]